MILPQSARVVVPDGDVDEFLRQLYLYKTDRGYAAGLARRVTNLVALPVLALLSVAATGFLRWEDLLTCVRDPSKHFSPVSNATSNADCGSLLGFVDAPVAPWTLRKVVAVMQLVFFAAWWLASVVYMAPFIRRGLAMRAFCTRVLGLHDADVANEPWHNLLARVATVCGGGCGGGSREDPEAVSEMCARLLRRENYWTALYTCHTLDVWRLGPGPLDLAKSHILYRVLDVCVVQQTALRPFAVTGCLPPAKTIQRRVWACAVGLAVALPFTLPFYVTRGILRYMPDLHQRRAHPRGWSHAAVWTMRDFNETDAAVEVRQARAATHATGYLACFEQPVVHAVVIVTVMVARFALGLLIIVALVDERVLSAVKVGPTHNLLWVMGLLTAVVAMAPSPTKSSDSGNSEGGASTSFARLCAAMHYAPPSWRKAGVTQGFSTAAAVRDMFPLRIVDAAREALTVLLAPFTLLIASANPKRIEGLVRDLSALSVLHESVGYVCGAALGSTPTTPAPAPVLVATTVASFDADGRNVNSLLNSLCEVKAAKSALALELARNVDGPKTRAVRALAMAKSGGGAGEGRHGAHVMTSAALRAQEIRGEDVWFFWADVACVAESQMNFGNGVYDPEVEESAANKVLTSADLSMSMLMSNAFSV